MKPSTEQMRIDDLVEYYLITSIENALYASITAKPALGNDQVNVWVDESFQRVYGAWPKEKKSRYIESIFASRICTPIVLAETTQEYRDKNNLGQKYKWTILDGMHRSTIICEFLDSKIGFTGYTFDGDKFVFRENKLYKDLSEIEQRTFLKSYIEIKTISDINAEQYAEVFITINDGEHLNSQEKRNPIDCEIARWSRDQDQDNETIWERMGKVRSKTLRMSAREFVSKVYGFLVNLEDVNKSLPTLDDKFVNTLYFRDAEMNTDIKSYLDLQLFPSIKPIAEKRRKQKNRIIKAAEFWTYMIIHHNLTRVQNISYTDDISNTFSDDILWEYSTQVLNKLINKSEKQHNLDFTAAEEGKMTEESLKSQKYFFQEISRFHGSASSKLVVEEITRFLGNKVNFISLLQQFEQSLQPIELAAK